MVFFKKESLVELKDRVSLVDVIQAYMPLTRAGAAYKGLCPFHDEKTPSFTIQSGDQHYHCFGCQAHGDAIQFLMDYLKISFGETVELLADQFHVRLEREKNFDKSHENRKRAKEALQVAMRFYQMMLRHTKEGAEALDYLYSRGIPLAFIDRFQIGYAPSEALGFVPFMKEKGFRIDDLKEAGLLTQHGKPFFAERITFPIHHPSGYTIGFSARKFKESTFGGKYVNSPETLLFKKSQLLFGLNYSRRNIAKDKHALIVEGQLDALRLIDAGIDYTVAGQGTAFTEHQAQVLMTLGVERVYLAFDADHAGRSAACKVGDFFQKEGIEVSILKLPPGQDPDSILCMQGKEAFLNLLKTPQDYLAFLIDFYGEGQDLSIPACKDQLARKISQQVRSWNHTVLIHESLKKLAEMLEIPPHTLGIKGPPKRFHASGPAEIDKRFQINPDRILEMDLLRWLLSSADEQSAMLTLCQENINEEIFLIKECREIYKALLEAHKTEKEVNFLSLAIFLEDESAQGALEEISSKKVALHRIHQGMQETLKKLLDRNWLLAKEKIKRKIHEGNQSQDEIFALVRDYNTLNQNPPKLKLAHT